MVLFLIWTGILFAGIAGFFVYVMKRRRIGFRFQTRITILMLVFSLFPAVPLILLSIEIINQGIYQLGSKNIEDILNGSLEAIRQPLIQKTSLLLDRIEANFSREYIASLAADENCVYVLKLNLRGETVTADTLYIARGKPSTGTALTKEAFNTYLSEETFPALDTERSIFDNYRVINGSSIILIGLPVEKNTVEMVKKIERTAASYGMIYVLFIKGKLGYIAAVMLVFLLTIAVVTAAWHLSKSTTGPIKDLAEGFKKVGEGDLSVSVQSKAKDEIAFLITSFNAMVSELKNTQQKLIQSERIAAWRDVARQISHEIKNPLTPIQLSLHRLRKKIIIPDENTDAIEESFKTIEEEIESLRRLASEFSEFARMPKPSLTVCSITAVIQGAASLYKKNTKNVPLQLDLAENIPDCLIDPEQLKRALINIITNGIDATPDNGNPVKIKCSLPASSHTIEIVISDGGAGMDAETLNHIFDPYFTTKSGGTGLGMNIVKRIIEEHNGSITITSTPGKGTTAAIQLPVRSNK